MHRVADAVARGLIVAALVAPAAAFAAAPSVVSVSSDGLILTSLTPTPYPITVTFDQDVAVAPIVTMVEDGITPPVNDCSDANLATFCFSYDIPQGVEAGLFKNVRIEGAQNAGGETMAPTPPNSHRFIVDSGGPIVTVQSAARNTPLPTITGFTTEATSPVAVTVNATSYNVTPAAGVWSLTIPAGSELSEGTYTVTAIGSDPFGNPSAPAQGTLIIDLTKPVVTITHGIADGGYAGTTSPESILVSFSFSVFDALPVSTVCAFDNDLLLACGDTLSKTYTGEGAHVFIINANDTAGNITSVVRSFFIDLTAPIVAEVAPIPRSTNNQPEYTFTINEPGTINYEGPCTSQTRAAAAGENTIELDALAAGTYNTCALTVADGAGNLSDRLAITPFIIDPDTLPLTVTADSRAMILGGELPPLSATLTGFAAGDTAQNSTTGSPQCTTTATSASPVGTYPITCTVGTLASSAYTFDTFVAGTLRIVYRFDGFLQPINDTAHQIGQNLSVFKAGSTVPVKLQLKKSDGTVVSAAVAPEWLSPLRGGPMSAPVGEYTYTDAATPGSSFKLADDHYQYNWKTGGLAPNYWYHIFVRLDDGQVYAVTIGLR